MESAESLQLGGSVSPWSLKLMVLGVLKPCMESLSCLASCLATSSNKAKAAVLNSLYGRLNLNLVKANATAMLSRCSASDMYTV